MKHNSNLAPSRKAWCERNLLILAIVFVIGLCSCGIRPLNRPDNNISGIETTYLEETDPPETDEETQKPFREPITKAPENYPHEYNPFSGGTGQDTYNVLSYLSDEAYIKEHTVGYFYIQNKRLQYYLTSKNLFWYDNLTEEQKYTAGLMLYDDIKNATVFQMIELDNGYYAFISPIVFACPFGGYSTFRYALNIGANRINTGAVNIGVPTITHLWEQSFIVKETPSEAYTLTTRLMDYYTDCVLEIRYLTESDEIAYYSTVFNRPYTPDDDYSDEWLFIPAEPPETTAP